MFIDKGIFVYLTQGTACRNLFCHQNIKLFLIYENININHHFPFYCDCEKKGSLTEKKFFVAIHFNILLFGRFVQINVRRKA